MKKIIENFQNGGRPYKVIIFLIFSLAVFLRLYSLFIRGTVSFDEAWSQWIGAKDLLSVIMLSATDKHPPFFYVLMHFWNMFYYSELWIRIPSFLASLFAFSGFYLLAKELFKSKIAITFALLLFAVDYYQVNYASIARMYSIETTFVVFSVYTFIKALKSGEKKWLLSNVILNILILLTHYVGIFTVIIEIAVLAVFYIQKKLDKDQIKKWVKYYLPVLAVELAFIPYLYIQLKGGGFAPKWIALLHGYPSLFDLFQQATLMNLSPFNLDSSHYQQLLGILIFVFMLGNIITIKNSKVLIRKDFDGWFLGFIYVTPVVVFWIVSNFDPIFVSRYFIPYNFVYYLLLIAGLFSRMFSKVAIPFSLIFVIGFFMYTNNKIDKPYLESDWRTKTGIISANWRDDDVVFVVPHGDLIRIKFYSGENSSLKIERQLYKDVFKSKPKPVSDQDLKDVFLNWNYPYKRLWFHEEIDTGLSAEFYVQEEGTIFNFLKKHFVMIEEVGFQDERGRLSLFVLNEVYLDK